jgi:hypothetical protein
MLGHNQHLIEFVRAVVVRRPFLRPTVEEVRRKFEVMYRQLFLAPTSSSQSTTAAAQSTTVAAASLHASAASASQPKNSTASLLPPAWLSALLSRRGDDATVNIDESAASVSAAAASQTPAHALIITAAHASDHDNMHVAAVGASVAHSVRAAATDLVSATAIDTDGNDDDDGNNDDDSKTNAAAALTRKQIARRVLAASASVSSSAAAPFSFEPSLSSSALSEDGGGQTLPPVAPSLVAAISSHAAAASTAEPKSQSSATSSSSSSLVAARTAVSASALSSSSSSSLPIGNEAPHDAWRGPLLRTVSTAAPNLLFGIVFAYIEFLTCSFRLISGKAYLIYRAHHAYQSISLL